jgi:hypothetical protein
MLKNILKLDGAQQLTATEQKSINGGTTVICQKAMAQGDAIYEGFMGYCPPEYPNHGGNCCFKY